MYEGIALIDKPSGITSHDVVDRVRKKLKMRRVGHAGTLDPLATGLMIVLIGKATKLSEQFMGFDKEYTATLKLGVRTDTLDTQGEVLSMEEPKVSREELTQVLKRYEGNFLQSVPAYSAVKVNGLKLYEYARKGLKVPEAKRDVVIEWIHLKAFDLPFAQIALKCSKGTYVRQVAEDVGNDLGCGACISALRRESIGQFNVTQAQRIEEFNESYIRDWAAFQAAK